MRFADHTFYICVLAGLVVGIAALSAILWGLDLTAVGPVLLGVSAVTLLGALVLRRRRAASAAFLDRSDPSTSSTTQTIYIRLIDGDRTDWRPVPAIPVREDTFMILSDIDVPPHESWEFMPGSVVRCETRDLGDGEARAAVKEVTWWKSARRGAGDDA